MALEVENVTVRPFTESDDTRIKELCIKLVVETSLYYDARSEKHKKNSRSVAGTCCYHKV